MRTLAIETSSLHGSVAVIDGDDVLATALRTDQRSAQSLAPAIRELLTQAGWQIGDLDLIGVVEGPGSFTGLRVGIATAKTLAYACDAAVVSVNTLEAIARQAPLECGHVTAVLDAQRQQLFVARYEKTGHETSELAGTHIVAVDDLAASLSPDGYITGPGLKRVATNDLPCKLVDAGYWEPTATTVGQLCLQRFSGGTRTTCWELVPRYYRQSAAEEKARRTS